MANPISLNGNRSALENLPVRLRQDIGNYRVKKQNGYEIRVHAANSRMRAEVLIHFEPCLRIMGDAPCLPPIHSSQALSGNLQGGITSGPLAGTAGTQAKQKGDEASETFHNSSKKYPAPVAAAKLPCLREETVLPARDALISEFNDCSRAIIMPLHYTSAIALSRGVTW